MQAFLWQQGEFLLRILLAGVCGAMIGYERKSRNKEAGIRTHMIVAMGAALIMIVSKYGFGDLLGKEGVALDPSRIAAQIVTGVGFLGAGMIFCIKIPFPDLRLQLAYGQSVLSVWRLEVAYIYWES